jgi:hypothetical protein
VLFVCHDLTELSTDPLSPSCQPGSQRSSSGRNGCKAVTKAVKPRKPPARWKNPTRRPPARRAAAAVECHQARRDRSRILPAALTLSGEVPHGAPCKLGVLRRPFSPSAARPAQAYLRATKERLHFFLSVAGGVERAGLGGRRLRIDEVLIWRRDERAPRHPPLFRAGRARRGMQALYDLAL